MTVDASEVDAAVVAAYRSDWARVVSTVARLVRDLDLAEDCAQDAFLQASARWQRDGIPDRPGGWLTTTAVNRALQVRRHERVVARKLPLLVVDDQLIDPPVADHDDPFSAFPDDRLRLIFTCAHSALTADARMALTLRIVCGLTVPDIAAAFLTKPATIQARITRAKKKIAVTGIPYRVPDRDEIGSRLESVLDTVYLVYNAGHLSAVGDQLTSDELAERALALSSMLRELLPDDPEVMALHALLLLTDARRPARTDPDGRLIPLADQDRRRWSQQAIAEGKRLLHAAIAGDAVGRFTVMAAIGAVHASAPRWEDTDWPQILKLYRMLGEQWPSPVVSLNRAIAVGQVHGPGAGLAALAELAGEPALASYPYLPAARADMLRRLGRYPEAAQAYRDAVVLTANGAEIDYLNRRLGELPASTR